MPDPQLVDPHDPVMTGENSFLRLSGDGGKTFVHRTSHWRVLWSLAGQGHVLFIESPLAGDSAGRRPVAVWRGRRPGRNRKNDCGGGESSFRTLASVCSTGRGAVRDKAA